VTIHSEKQIKRNEKKKINKETFEVYFETFLLNFFFLKKASVKHSIFSEWRGKRTEGICFEGDYN